MTNYHGAYGSRDGMKKLVAVENEEAIQIETRGQISQGTLRVTEKLRHSP